MAINGVLCPRLDLGPALRVAMFDVSQVPGVQPGNLALLQGCCDNDGNILEPAPQLGAVSLSVPRIAIWS